MASITAWATTSTNTLGADAGVSVEEEGRGIIASEVVDLALDAEDGGLDKDAADQILEGLGYRRTDSWRESGGQWGATVEQF